MTPLANTTASLLTPPGTGAIAVIRIEGSKAFESLAHVFRPGKQQRLTRAALAGGKLRYGWIMDGRERIDDVLVVAANLSDLTAFDIMCHGGVRVVERIMGVLTNHSPREGTPDDGCTSLATPAILPSDVFAVSGALEGAVLDAIFQAKTKQAATFLCQLLESLRPAVTEVVELCSRNAKQAAEKLAAMVRDSDDIRRLVEGVNVALVGPPNSGKSTLFNRLLGREAAVVSAKAGTTRDWVDHTYSVGGLPVRLYDTAGVRGTEEKSEKLAIDRGQKAVDSADLYLLVVDAQGEVEILESGWIDRWKPTQPVIVVVNKADCDPVRDSSHLLISAKQRSWPVVRISAVTGSGLDALQEKMVRKSPVGRLNQVSPCFCSANHVDIALQALKMMTTDPTAAGILLRQGLLAS